MAVELTLQNGRWSPRALKQFFESWAPTAPLPLLTWMPWENSPVGLRTWFFAEGSTRGVSLVRRMSLTKGAPITLRLNSMASRADWTVAYALLRGLLRGRGGRVVGPDGGVMRPEHLTDGEAVGDGLTQIGKDAREVADTLNRGERYAIFPNPEFAQLVTQPMLPKDDDPARFGIHFEELLREMGARYQRAEVVEPTQLPDGSLLAVWSQDDALLPIAHHIGVRRGAEATDGVVLPAAQALDLLGNRLEIVSEGLDRFFVPALDASNAEDRTLTTRLMKAGTPAAEFFARYQRSRQGAI